MVADWTLLAQWELARSAQSTQCPSSNARFIVRIRLCGSCQLIICARFLAAGIKTDVGGLTLFKADGSVVYTTGPLPLIGRESNPHDTYFSVDADGNLRTYYLVKGMFWATDFEALATDCDLPNYCGSYGVCSNNVTCRWALPTLLLPM